MTIKPNDIIFSKPNVVYGVDDNGNELPVLVNEHGTLQTETRGNLDVSGRSSFNGIFGEQYVAMRVPKISANFNFTPDTRRTTSSVANGGSAGVIGNMMTIQSGVNNNGTAVLQSKEGIRYSPARDCEMMVTANFSVGVANSYQRVGLYDGVNGVYFGYEGATFGLTVLKNSVAVFTPITEFNGHPLVSDTFTYNPQMLNIYRLVFGYLGIAPITLELYMGKDIGWRPMHIYDVVGKQTGTHIASPYLSIRAEVGNTGNTTNVKIESGSVYAGVIDGSGAPDASSREFSGGASVTTLASGTDRPLIIYHNKQVYQSQNHKIEALLLKVGIGAISGSNKPIIIRLYKLNAVPTGAAYTNVDLQNSIMEYSTTGTISLTGAELLDAWALGANGQVNLNVKDLNHLLLANEYAVFTASSAGTMDIELLIRWAELF